MLRALLMERLWHVTRQISGSSKGRWSLGQCKHRDDREGFIRWNIHSVMWYCDERRAVLIGRGPKRCLPGFPVTVRASLLSISLSYPHSASYLHASVFFSHFLSSWSLFLLHYIFARLLCILLSISFLFLFSLSHALYPVSNPPPLS